MSIFATIVLQFDHFLKLAGDFENILIFIFQAIVVVLTVIKIYQDVKTKHYENLNKSVEETKQKYPLLYAIFNYIESLKHKKDGTV